MQNYVRTFYTVPTVSYSTTRQPLPDTGSRIWSCVACWRAVVSNWRSSCLFHGSFSLLSSHTQTLRPTTAIDFSLPLIFLHSFIFTTSFPIFSISLPDSDSDSTISSSAVCFALFSPSLAALLLGKSHKTRTYVGLALTWFYWSEICVFSFSVWSQKS